MSIDQLIIYRQFHGSIGERYQDLPGTDLPREWSAVIPSGVDDLLAHREQNIPRNHSLLRVSLNGRDLLLRSVAARSSISVSRTFYNQKYLLDVTPRILLDRFDDLLRIDFYSGEAFNRAAANAFEQPRGYAWSDDGMTLDIPANTLKAVLFGMLFRWYRKRAPVVVAVPEDVDYDAYTFAAVKTIYSYLPAGLRYLMGFMTYADPAAVSKEVALVFVPAEYNYASAILLDGTTTNIAPLLSNGLPQSAKDMLSELVAMDPDQRSQALEDITADIETSGDGRFADLSSLYITNYTDYWATRGRVCRDLEDPDDFALLRDFANDPRSQPGNRAAVYERIIRENVRTDHLDRHFLNTARAKADPAAFYWVIQPWLKLCALGSDRSDDLEGYVWNAFWSFCAELVQKQADLQALKELDRQVRETIHRKVADDGGDPLAVRIETREPYHRVYSERVAAFLEEALGSSKERFFDELDRLCVVLGVDPAGQYAQSRKTFLRELPGDFSEKDEAVQKILNDAEARRLEMEKQYGEELLRWFEEQLPPLPDLITQEEHDEQYRQLDQLCTDQNVTAAPKSARDAFMDRWTDRVCELAKLLQQSTERYDQINLQIKARSKDGYFSQLETLIKDRDCLSPPQFQETLSSIRADFRPGGLDAYLQAYHAHYGKIISVADLGTQGTAPVIIKDLREIFDPQEPYALDLYQKKDLCDILHAVQERRLLCEYLCGEPQMIHLEHSKQNTYSFPADALHEMLKGLTDTRPFEYPASEQELTVLLEILRTTHHFRDSDRYRVLRYLKDAPDGWAKKMYRDEKKAFLTFHLRNKDNPLDPESLYGQLKACWDRHDDAGIPDNESVTLFWPLKKKQIIQDTYKSFPLNKLYTTLEAYLEHNVDRNEQRSIKPLDAKDQKALASCLAPLMTPRQLISTARAILRMAQDHNEAKLLQETATIYMSRFFKKRNAAPIDKAELYLALVQFDKEKKIDLSKEYSSFHSERKSFTDIYELFDPNHEPKSEPKSESHSKKVPFCVGGPSEHFLARCLCKLKDYFGRSGNVGEYTPEAIEEKKKQLELAEERPDPVTEDPNAAAEASVTEPEAAPEPMEAEPESHGTPADNAEADEAAAESTGTETAAAAPADNADTDDTDDKGIKTDTGDNADTPPEPKPEPRPGKLWKRVAIVCMATLIVETVAFASCMLRFQPWEQPEDTTAPTETMSDDNDSADEIPDATIPVDLLPREEPPRSLPPRKNAD